MDAGVATGLDGTITASDDEHITFASPDGDHVLTCSVAETVSVTADPSPPPRTAVPRQLVLGGRYGR